MQMEHILLKEVLLVWAVLITTISAMSYNSGPRDKCGLRQSCWPSIQEWETFNGSLSENLYRTVPHAAT